MPRRAALILSAGALILFTPLMLYAGLLGADVLGNLAVTPLTSIEDVKSVIADERVRAGIDDDVRIHALLLDETVAYVHTIEEGYLLAVGGHTATRQTIRHELMHISSGHADAHANRAKYLLLQEPRALAYGIFG